jgi:hypothetical protein
VTTGDEADEPEGHAAPGDPVRAEPWPGAGLVAIDTWTTIVFVVVVTAATIVPDLFTVPLVVVSIAMAAVGVAAFVWAYVVAISRSREEEIAVAGIYFLSGGAAPAGLRRLMLGLWFVQIAVALVASSVRIFTPVAFASLAPMFGIGLLGLWGAGHGEYPRRSDA